jgi:hypothetical protein
MTETLVGVSPLRKAAKKRAIVKSCGWVCHDAS